jgi:adenine-specific DNA-methyltransferase
MRNLYRGDCLEFLSELRPGGIQTFVTSPPYNIGKEYETRTSLAEYEIWVSSVARGMFDAVSETGSIFFNVGNYVSRGEVVPLDVICYPIFKALGMQLRNRIVWTFGHGLHASKRLSGRHETVLWFTKTDSYLFDLDSIRVPSKYPNKRHFKGPKKGQLSGNPLGKNPGDVWDISNVKHNHPEKTDHPCQFPEALVERAILATSVAGDTVADPFMGSGTTAAVAQRLGRDWLGAEQFPDYWPIIESRVQEGLL